MLGHTRSEIQQMPGGARQERTGRCTTSSTCRKPHRRQDCKKQNTHTTRVGLRRREAMSGIASIIKLLSLRKYMVRSITLQGTVIPLYLIQSLVVTSYVTLANKNDYQTKIVCSLAAAANLEANHKCQCDSTSSLVLCLGGVSRLLPREFVETENARTAILRTTFAVHMSPCLWCHSTKT